MTESKSTPFSQQLAFLNKGTLDAEVTEKLEQLVKAVRETGKGGDIILKLTVQPLNKRNEDQLRIIPDVKLKLPELEKAETIMFSTADGDLLRDDPNQIKMDLKVIDEKPAVMPINLAASAN